MHVFALKGEVLLSHAVAEGEMNMLASAGTTKY